jgi:beta-mannanase
METSSCRSCLLKPPPAVAAVGPTPRITKSISASLSASPDAPLPKTSNDALGNTRCTQACTVLRQSSLLIPSSLSLPFNSAKVKIWSCSRPAWSSNDSSESESESEFSLPESAESLADRSFS